LPSQHILHSRGGSNEVIADMVLEEHLGSIENLVRHVGVRVAQELKWPCEQTTWGQCDFKIRIGRIGQLFPLPASDGSCSACLENPWHHGSLRSCMRALMSFEVRSAYLSFIFCTASCGGCLGPLRSTNIRGTQPRLSKNACLRDWRMTSWSLYIWHRLNQWS
jgi:hypothetical protein